MHTYKSESSQTQATLDYPQSFFQPSLGIVAADPTIERLKSLYKAPHQAEFLYLQAEADSLLRQLETVKSRRSSTTLRQ